MNPGTPAEQPGSSLPVEPASAPRRKRRIVLITALLFLPVALAVLVIFEKGKPPSAGMVKISQAAPGAPVSFGRRVMLRVENKSGNALLLWEPCRIERKETGKIIMGGTEERVMPLGGTNGGTSPGMTVVSVQLTGSNRGPWRVLMPVTRYELPARLDAIFHQRLGTLGMKFGLLKHLLRNSRTWIASDWFEEGSPTFAPFTAPPAGLGLYVTNSFASRFSQAQVERRNVLNMLHLFHEQFQRWPTNLAEVIHYAKSTGAPVPSSQFGDAEFTPGPDSLSVIYDHGRGSLMVSESGKAGQALPDMFDFAPGAIPDRMVRGPPRPGLQIAPALPERSVRAPQFGAITGVLRGPDDSPQTVMFIIKSFRAEYKRWPTNTAEVKAFAANPAHFQPEFPQSLDEAFESAVFTMTEDGGLKVSHKNGSMSLGKPK